MDEVDGNTRLVGSLGLFANVVSPRPGYLVVEHVVSVDDGVDVEVSSTGEAFGLNVCLLSISRAHRGFCSMTDADSRRVYPNSGVHSRSTKSNSTRSLSQLRRLVFGIGTKKSVRITFDA